MQKIYKNIGAAKYIQNCGASKNIGAFKIFGKNLAHPKSLADGKNSAHPKSLADGKNTAHPKSLSDGKNLAHPKSFLDAKNLAPG
jgi:hypothetical protein